MILSGFTTIWFEIILAGYLKGDNLVLQRYFSIVIIIPWTRTPGLMMLESMNFSWGSLSCYTKNSSLPQILHRDSDLDRKSARFGMNHINNLLLQVRICQRYVWKPLFPCQSNRFSDLLIQIVSTFCNLLIAWYGRYRGWLTNKLAPATLRFSDFAGSWNGRRRLRLSISLCPF